MEGLLKKRVKEIKLFQAKEYIKRYWILDFRIAQITILKEKDDPNGKEMQFRSILDCTIPGAKVQTALKNQINSTQFVFPFRVFTSEREFLLFASSEEERQMWVSGFQYIIISTREMQKIIVMEDKRRATPDKRAQEQKYEKPTITPLPKPLQLSNLNPMLLKDQIIINEDNESGKDLKNYQFEKQRLSGEIEDIQIKENERLEEEIKELERIQEIRAKRVKIQEMLMNNNIQQKQLNIKIKQNSVNYNHSPKQLLSQFRANSTKQENNVNLRLAVQNNHQDLDPIFLSDINEKPKKKKIKRKKKKRKNQSAMNFSADIPEKYENADTEPDYLRNDLDYSKPPVFINFMQNNYNYRQIPVKIQNNGQTAPFKPNYDNSCDGFDYSKKQQLTVEDY